MSSLSVYTFVVSIVLSLGRNMLSKEISDSGFGNKVFFRFQSLIFAFGFLTMAIAFLYAPCAVSYITVCYALIYAVLLLCAQWCYTAALKNGSTSICVTIYSLGFILPTLSGTIFWGEEFNLRSLLGTVLVVVTVIISGMNARTKAVKSHKKYFVPLIISMLSSGGLGIMQKVQQNSQFADQRTAFVLIAFAVATIFSAIFSTCNNHSPKTASSKKYFCAAGAGATFGCCNLANTYLAGKFKSSFFFPVQNISVIILSHLASMIIFRERTGRKEIGTLILGSMAIYLLST